MASGSPSYEYLLRSHDERNASSPSRVFHFGFDRFVGCSWKPSRCFASYQRHDPIFAVPRRCTSSKAGAKSVRRRQDRQIDRRILGFTRQRPGRRGRRRLSPEVDRSGSSVRCHPWRGVRLHLSHTGTSTAGASPAPRHQQHLSSGGVTVADELLCKINRARQAWPGTTLRPP